MLRHPVIVTAKDQAGNLAVQQVNLRDMIASTLTPPPMHRFSRRRPSCLAKSSQTVNRPI